MIKKQTRMQDPEIQNESSETMSKVHLFLIKRPINENENENDPLMYIQIEVDGNREESKKERRKAYPERKEGLKAKEREE